MAGKLIYSIKNKIKKYRKNNSFQGRWELFEYYLDEGNDLIHIEEIQLKSSNQEWILEFKENGQFKSSSTLDIPVIKKIEATRWLKKGRMLHLIFPANNQINMCFQYAFDKGTMKLLKKDKSGKIEVFAFFKRSPV